MICDCLNTCGDDPWLKDGRVQPCKNFIKREQQDKLALEKMAKVTKIAELYGAGADFDLVILLHERLERVTAHDQFLADSNKHLLAECELLQGALRVASGMAPEGLGIQLYIANTLEKL